MGCRFVQRREDLVEEPERSGGGDQPSERQSPALSSRQVARREVRLVTQGHALQYGLCFVA